VAYVELIDALILLKKLNFILWLVSQDSVRGAGRLTGADKK